MNRNHWVANLYENSPIDIEIPSYKFYDMVAMSDAFVKLHCDGKLQDNHIYFRMNVTDHNNETVMDVCTYKNQDYELSEDADLQVTQAEAWLLSC